MDHRFPYSLSFSSFAFFALSSSSSLNCLSITFALCSYRSKIAFLLKVSSPSSWLCSPIAPLEIVDCLPSRVSSPWVKPLTGLTRTFLFKNSSVAKSLNTSPNSRPSASPSSCRRYLIPFSSRVTTWSMHSNTLTISVGSFWKIGSSVRIPNLL